MKQHSVLKPAGFIEVTGPYGELKRGETLKCVHCQHSWIVEPGSGKMRGFCQRCNGYTCGGKNCLDCIPAEHRLENIEAGRPELTPKPVMIVVPAGIESVSTAGNHDVAEAEA